MKFIDFFFLDNSYPAFLVENCISKFLNKIFSPEHLEDNVVNKYCIKLPYYGHLSFVGRKRLTQLFKLHFPDTIFRSIFTNSRTIKSYFHYKDPIPVGLTPNMVYQYTCLQCKLRHIGETKRNLSRRVAEHRVV